MSIICGDCLDVMKAFPDNHFSAIVTDPPYGLSFMNKEWDNVLPKMSYWKEALRISKPGSFLISMGGTRTFHRLCCEIEDAGWEIRDCISYLYGSGFPKSHNHFGISGQGTALKPAWEPCIVAMKPCDGTFKNNAEKWGQAGINIDGCRIGDETISAHGGGINVDRLYGMGKGIPAIKAGSNSHKGRWPANVILDEEAGRLLDEQSGFSRSSPSASLIHEDRRGDISYSYKHKYKRCGGHDDSGGASRFFKSVDFEMEELIFCRAKAIMRSWNPSFANIVDKNSVLSKEVVDFALKDAAIRANHEGKLLKSIQTPFTNVTANELENLCLTVIIMILSIEKRYWHGLFHLNMAKSNENVVNLVEIRRQTDIITITTNHSNMFGFVVDVISENMSEYQEHGEKVFQNRIIYCAKASSRERNEGLEGLPALSNMRVNGPRESEDAKFATKVKNNHPTIKPLKLMEYLIKLVMPPSGGILLDPFAGSGTTILAAKNLGFDGIGIEKSEEYSKIARARLGINE